MKRNKSGISLIVLVITIIVMIILAAAIILSLSSSGIIGKANQAKRDTDSANLREAAAIALAEYELEVNVGDLDDTTTTAEDYVKSKLRGQFSKQQIDSVKVHDDGTIDIYPVIPDGFVVSEIESEQKIAEGLVVYEIPEASRSSVSWTETVTIDGAEILKVQNEYNQFVWVPVPDIAKFERTTIYDGVTIRDPGQNYAEPAKVGYNAEYQLVTLSKENDLTGAYAEHAAMKESVKNHGGFYIARYEAGKEGTNTLVSKKGANVWYGMVFAECSAAIGNYGAVWFSRQMYPNSTSVVSTLCYGVQWDATMNFMKDVPNPTVRGKKYIDDSTGMAWDGVSDPKKTGIDMGETALNRVKNIYDMAGNMEEWTMEADQESCVLRGGSSSPKTRYSIISNAAEAFRGFRPTLYLK